MAVGKKTRVKIKQAKPTKLEKLKCKAILQSQVTSEWLALVVLRRYDP